MKLNWNKILHDTYVELFKEATPSADFDDLVKNGILGSDGRLIIPFNDYELEDDKFDEIMNRFIKKYRIPKAYRSNYQFAILLGASPRTKIN